MRIGARELQQYASQYLARAQRGEVIEVTSRGRVVARLVPAIGGRWEQTVAAGLAQPATRDLLDVAPIDLGFSASAQLATTREDER